jgi:hypothetical protein
MRVVRVEGLPQAPLDAAAAFYAQWLPKIAVLFDPPRNGEVAARSADGGVAAPPQSTELAENSRPLHHPSGGPPPRSGEDLLLVFPLADHTHRSWRLAAVQELARKAAPLRVNGVAADSETAISSALSYLAKAPGVTGQYWLLDGAGAEGA